MDFGSVQLGFSVVRHFAVVNQTAVALTAPAVTLPPGDFALSGAAPGGFALQPGQSAGFYVQFTPTATGARGGSLVIGGSTYALAGTGVRLAYQVDTGAGLQPLGAGPVDFGSVELGFSVARHFALANQTAVVLTAPAIAVPAGDFALSGLAPGGLAIPPGQSADFYVQFTPTATGARTGSLIIGGSAYALAGTGVEPPLPNPGLSISLPRALSAQQGAVAVTLDAPSRTSGSGTLTLDFQPASGLADDALIVFASGGRTAEFTLSPGDTQGRFGAQSTAPFQTGTTAGTLIFTVRLGGVTALQTITILPASVGVYSVEGVRSAAALQVRVTGFDNTRTAGPLTFTFFDAAGNAVAPGAIRTDATASFASYFQNSGRQLSADGRLSRDGRPIAGWRFPSPDRQFRGDRANRADRILIPPGQRITKALRGPVSRQLSILRRNQWRPPPYPTGPRPPAAPPMCADRSHRGQGPRRGSPRCRSTDARKLRRPCDTTAASPGEYPRRSPPDTELRLRPEE
jgi:hypothetical protein